MILRILERINIQQTNESYDRLLIGDIKHRTTMKRPHVICHMASSADGRIIADNWGEKERREAFRSLYEQCHESFASQA